MLCTALALISMCAQFANGQVTASGREQRPVFTMSISLKQTTVRPGSEVRIDIDLKNTSAREIQIWLARSGPPLYTFKVLDRTGKAAPLTPQWRAILSGKGEHGQPARIMTGSGWFARVDPGGTLHDVFVISSFVDLSQPDQYTIRLERTDPYTELLVESNTLTLTVAKQDLGL
jgi:hypothetical protein